MQEILHGHNLHKNVQSTSKEESQAAPLAPLASLQIDEIKF